MPESKIVIVVRRRAKPEVIDAKKCKFCKGIKADIGFLGGCQDIFLHHAVLHPPLIGHSIFSVRTTTVCCSGTVGKKVHLFVPDGVHSGRFLCSDRPAFHPRLQHKTFTYL